MKIYTIPIIESRKTMAISHWSAIQDTDIPVDLAEIYLNWEKFKDVPK